MKHNKTRALAPGSGGRGLHLDGHFHTAVVQPAVETQRPKTRVSQLAGLAGMLDDRHDAWPEPAHPGPKRKRSRERRRVRGEIAGRLIEPAAEIRLHVSLTDERENVAVVHATQRADSAAPLVFDESAQHDIGARRDVAFEPVAAACPWDIRAVTALRDDPFETVLRDDVEERLAVLGQVLRRRDHAAADPEGGQAAAALLEGTGQERSVVFVQEIERHEDRPPAAFGGFRPEAAHEQVVAGAAARIADDDLAVEDRALRDRESRELWDQWKQVTAAAVGETKVAAVHRRDGAEAVPLQLEEMIGGVERVCREARPHGCEIPRQRSVRARDLEESWMLAARRARITTHSPSISSGPCLRRFLSRALLARRGLLAC